MPQNRTIVFDDAQPQQAPQQPPQYPGVIRGQPAAPDPAERTRLGFEAERLRLAQEASRRAEAQANREAEEAAAEQRQAAEEAAAAAQGQTSRRAQVSSIINTIARLENLTRDGSGIGSIEGQESFRSGEDFLGASRYFNQDANDVAGLIEQIQGDLTQQILARLVEENGGRGASGMANTAAEAQRMAAAIAPLSPTMSDAEFKAGLAKARAYYERTLSDLGGELPPQNDAQYSNPGAQGQTGAAPANANDPNDPDQPLRGRVSAPYYDAEGNEIGDDYTGPAYDQDGTLYGQVYRGENGERQLIREEARQLAENPALSIGDLGTPFGMAERAAGMVNQAFGNESGGLGALARHGQSLGLSDELTGIGTALGGALTGDFDVSSNYGVGRDAERYRLEQARQNSGWAGTAAEIGGGLTFGGGALRTGAARAMQAGRDASRFGGGVNRQAIQRAMTARTAGEGAAIGGAAGFGYGEGLEGSATNALIGAATGGVVGGALQARGNALANRGRTANEGAQVQQAAERIGMDTLPAMTGGPTARIMTGGAQQGFISARPIAQAAEKIQQQGAAARGRVAADVGEVVDNADAGEIVRRAANVYSRRTSEIGGKLYDRADRMAEGVEAPLPRAIDTARRFMDEIAQSPGGSDSDLYRQLETLVQQMDGGAFPISGIRALRTRLRDQMQLTGMRGSNADRVFGDVVDAAQEDMANALADAGRERAAQALQTANAFWRARVETIDEVLEPILGKTSQRSGEQITASLERLARQEGGDANRLRRLLAAMPDNEANSVRATIINRMGRPTNGSGEVVGEESFSLARFLTAYNGMSDRARSLMFPREAREALADLATVAGGAGRAGRAMNTSNTAGAAIAQTAISGGLWLIEPVTAFMAGVGQYGAGKLLASPRFARWLSGAPRNASPEAQNAYWGRLDRIARTEPAIASEIAALRAANDNAAMVGSAAAEQGEQR